MVRNGLREKIIAISSGVMLLVVIAIVASSSYIFRQAYTQALQSRSAAIATSLKVQLERILQLGINVDDLVGFEEQARDVVNKYESIKYAMVVGPDGLILFHSDPSIMRQRVTDPSLLRMLRIRSYEAPPLNVEGAGGYNAVAPVFGPGGVYMPPAWSWAFPSMRSKGKCGEC